MDIVTNPPYTLALEFVQKGLELVTEGHKIAMFLRIQFLEGLERYEKLYKNNHLKTVIVCVKRTGCLRLDEIEAGKPYTGAQCFAWFIFEKGYCGSPVIEWMNTGEGDKKHE